MEEANMLDKPIRDIEGIENMLPHRQPMIMVDGLSFYNGKKGIATLTIAESNIFVENGVFSETGLIEHMAQTAALHIGYKNYAQHKPAREGFIGGIKTFNCSRLVKLKETVTTEVEILYELESMTLVKTVSKINESIIATAEMSTVLNPLT